MNRYSVRYYVRKDTPTWEISKLHHKTTTGPMNLVSDYVSNNKMLHMFLEAENELQALEKATNEFKKHLARQKMNSVEWNGYIWTKVVIDNIQEDDVENNLPRDTLLVDKEECADNPTNGLFVS